MELEERLKNLVVQYIFHELRSYKGSIEKEKLSAFLTHVLTIEKLEEAFDYDLLSEIGCHSHWDYKPKLDSLVASRKPEEIERLNLSRTKLYKEIIQEVMEKLDDEVEVRLCAHETRRLRSRIADLEAQLEFGKPLEAVGFFDKLSSRVNLPYLIMLLLSITLIAGLSVLGLTTTMTVNVEFSVGEIIGALLVGTGVAAAGISYAANNTKDGQPDNEQ